MAVSGRACETVAQQQPAKPLACPGIFEHILSFLKAKHNKNAARRQAGLTCPVSARFGETSKGVALLRQGQGYPKIASSLHTPIE